MAGPPQRWDGHRAEKETIERQDLPYNLKHFGGNGFLVDTLSGMSKRGGGSALAGAGVGKDLCRSRSRRIGMGGASKRARRCGYFSLGVTETTIVLSR